MRLTQDYGVSSIYITENGSAWDDALEPDGTVHDAQRISYLERHLEALETARGAGAPVHGCFAWSFMDNFEWNSGYSKHFGLFYVDYADLARYPKDSAHYFRAHIAQGIKPS